MRYSRQEILKQIGKSGQEKLSNSIVAVVGLGATGSNSAELLARTGINLILIDRDIVELNNLQRQALYNEDDVNKAKAIQAREHLMKINSDITIETYIIDLNHNNLGVLDKADLILDCTDNLETRFLINEYCIKNNKTWIYSSVLGVSGFVKVFDNTVCFRCIFKEVKNLDSCDTLGVLNTITNLIASVQVNEAIKVFLNKDYENDLLFVNIWKNNIEKIKVNKRSDCNACNKKFEYINGLKKNNIIKLCGSNNFQFSGSFKLDALKSKLNNVKDYGYCLNFENMTIFRERVLIKAASLEEAKSLFSKYLGN